MASSLSHCFASTSSHSSITRPLQKPFNSKLPLRTTPLLQTKTPNFCSLRTRATLDGKDEISASPSIPVEEQIQHGKMKYYHPSKLLMEMVNRAIKTNSPVVGLMALHVRPGFAGAHIATLDMTGTEEGFLEALTESLSWDSLAEKLPNWISKYSIKGIIVSHVPLSPTSPRYLKEQHDLVEKLSKVEGIEDGFPYTFEEQTLALSSLI